MTIAIRVHPERFRKGWTSQEQEILAAYQDFFARKLPIPDYLNYYFKVVMQGIILDLVKRGIESSYSKEMVYALAYIAGNTALAKFFSDLLNYSEHKKLMVYQTVRRVSFLKITEWLDSIQPEPRKLRLWEFYKRKPRKLTYGEINNIVAKLYEEYIGTIGKRG